MSETWLNLSDAARAIGEHRQQLQRMLKAGKLPRRLVRDTQPPMLRLEGLAEAVQQGKRRRIDSRPGPPMEPKPPPDPITAAEQQLAVKDRHLLAAMEREAQWTTDYAVFRQWFSEVYPVELLETLPDPVPISALLPRLRAVVLARLAALDRCEMASRWPR